MSRVCIVILMALTVAACSDGGERGGQTASAKETPTVTSGNAERGDDTALLNSAPTVTSTSFEFEPHTELSATFTANDVEDDLVIFIKTSDPVNG